MNLKATELVCKCGKPLSIFFDPNWDGSGKDFGKKVPMWVLGHIDKLCQPLIHGPSCEEVITTFIQKRESGEY